MNWEDRSVKMKAREWLLEHIPSSLSINYVGLSAGTAIFEKMLCESRNVKSLRLFEKDPGIYAELMRTVYDEMWHIKNPFPENTTPLQGSIDFFLKRNTDYGTDCPDPNLLWLDYCGPITQDRLDSLRIGLTRRPRGGVVAVTFMACREPKTSTVLIDDLLDSTPWDLDMIENVPAYFLRKIRAVSSFALQADRNLKIEALPYKDGAPMMLIVFSDSPGRPTIEVEPYLKE